MAAAFLRARCGAVCSEKARKEHPRAACSPEHPLAYRRPTGGGSPVVPFFPLRVSMVVRGVGGRAWRAGRRAAEKGLAEFVPGAGFKWPDFKWPD